MTAFYLFGALLLALVAVVVWSAVREGASGGEREEPTPETRRDEALDLLREVEFEYRTGKLPEEEYRSLRDRYAIRALRARDEAARNACTSCGAPLGEPGGFCPACGAPRAASDD
ncbi:MAG: hypothetical protein ACE5HP_05345 [Gemmatimonadota bacterium]